MHPVYYYIILVVGVYIRCIGCKEEYNIEHGPLTLAGDYTREYTQLVTNDVINKTQWGPVIVSTYLDSDS